MAQKKKGGLFSGLTNAVNELGNELDRGVKSVTTDITNSTLNPLGYFQVGNVVMINSRMALRCLAVDNKGSITCKIPPTAIGNAAAQFQVVQSAYSPTGYKLRNMAHPGWYLSIANGFLVGNGAGGPECDFYGMVAPATSTVEIAEYMSLQSAMFPGSFVGVLKNGQITNPAQTSPSASHTAHFKLKYIKHAPPPPPIAGQPVIPQAQQPSPSSKHAAPPPGQPPPQGQQYPPQQGQQYPPQQGQQYPPQQGQQYPPQQGQQYPPQQGQQYPPQQGQQYPPQQGQQYPPATAPPPYSAYTAPAQQPSPGMEKRPL